METAHWLLKPASSIRSTWREPKETATWLSERLSEYGPGFASPADRDRGRLALLLNSLGERLGWGGDLSFGFYLFYLESPAFLALAVVTCSPNRAEPDHVPPEVAAGTGVPLGPGKRSSAMVVRGALVRRADGFRSW